MKNIVRKICFYLMLACYFPLHILYLLSGLIFGFDRMFKDFSQFMSILPGYIGSKLRGAFYYLTLEECSDEVFVEMGTFFVSRECRLGRGVYIGARCIISYADIGDDTLIGSHVNILSGKQQHIATDVNIPIRLQGGIRTKIHIGQDCWLGNGAIIMADVADKSIVAAGSIVTKEVEALSIVGGNPAKLIKKRA